MRVIDADALLTDRRKSKYYHLPNGDIAIPIIDIEHAPTIEQKSYEEAIKDIADASFTGDDGLDYVETLVALNVLKSMKYEPEPHWILCSERLPEEPYGCLVTVHWDDPYSGEYDQIYHEIVGYDGEGWNDVDGWTLPYEVIAWMPLPEPAKMER